MQFPLVEAIRGLRVSYERFHHDPSHDDATLDTFIEEAHKSMDLSFELIPGTEGAYFDL